MCLLYMYGTADVAEKWLTSVRAEIGCWWTDRLMLSESTCRPRDRHAHAAAHATRHRTTTPQIARPEWLIE